MSALFKRAENQKVARKQPESKLYRAISTASLIGLFVCVAIVVLASMRIIPFSSALVGIIGSIGCLCLGCVLMLPWIKRIERKQMKLVSIIFIALDALVPVLWIIALWCIIGSLSKGEISIGLMNFIKAVVIISLQFIVASYVAMGITKYKKTMLAFQVIAYASYLYVDFVVTFVLCCVKIGGSAGIAISDNIAFLASKFVWALFAIAVIFIAICNGFMYRTGFRRMREAADDYYLDEQEKTAKGNDTEEQLTKLKELLDKNLITQEEYDKKRAELLEKM